MEKTKIELGDVLSLGKEIVEGLLIEKIPFKTKYWLTRLAKSIEKENKIFDKLRNELVAKLGTKDKEGNIMITPTIKKGKKDIPNPAMEEFKKEIESVLSSSVELEHGTFTLEEFSDIKSENNYVTFYKLIKE